MCKTHFGPIAYCCLSCNSILSNKVFDNFQDRCAEVSNSLNEKTKAVIWSKEEMRKLDVSLKRFVEQDQAKRLWMRYRSDWYQSREYLLNIEPILWEGCFDRLDTQYNEFLFNYFESTFIWIKTLNWRRA